MSTYIRLRQFKPEELFLDEEETKIVLKFIFKPTDHPFIESLPMSDALRGFAQGLLVEIIDKSHTVGYIQSLFESTANPTRNAMKIIKKFAKKAAKRLFKNASVHDLNNMKIYDFVRDQVARAFKHKLYNFIALEEVKGRIGAFVAYQTPSQGVIIRWV